MRITKQQLTIPCVYQVLGEDASILYVGCGTSGMGRVFDISPDQKGRTKAFTECTEVMIDHFSDKAAAYSYESQLIHQLHPTHNAFCPKCGHYAKNRPKRLQGVGVVFGRTRHAMLSLLLNNPEKGYFLREVVRLLGTGHGATQRELKKLVQLGVLNRTQKGNFVFYQAEVNSPFFHEMQSMVRKGA